MKININPKATEFDPKQIVWSDDSEYTHISGVNGFNVFYPESISLIINRRCNLHSRYKEGVLQRKLIQIWGDE